MAGTASNAANEWEHKVRLVLMKTSNHYMNGYHKFSVALHDGKLDKE